MRPYALALVVTACGSAPSTPPVAPEAPRAPRVFLVERVGGEAFVLLGTESPTGPDVTPVIVGSEDDLALAVFPARFDVPELTPVGASPCETQTGEPVLVRRVLEQALEESYGSATLHEAVRIDAACAPELAIEGRRPDARLVTFEWEWSGDLGEPSRGTAAGGWSSVLRYGPSEDGICAGLPGEISVTPPSGPTARIELDVVLSRVLVLATSDGFSVLLASLTSYRVDGFPGGHTSRRRGYPTGVDFAEECL